MVCDAGHIPVDCGVINSCKVWGEDDATTSADESRRKANECRRAGWISVEDMLRILQAGVSVEALVDLIERNLPIAEEPYNYVPRLNDSVLLEGNGHRLIVIHVYASRRTAALTTLANPVIHYENVPWSKLCPEECQKPTCAD
jgi:hypothetical protein